MSASLTPARDRQTRDRGESPCGNVIAEMIPHPVKRRPSDRFRQTQPAQNRHAPGHQPFAARLLFGELPTLEEFHGETLASQQDRQRRPGDATPGDEHIRHR